jgi:hypothetical protein
VVVCELKHRDPDTVYIRLLVVPIQVLRRDTPQPTSQKSSYAMIFFQKTVVKSCGAVAPKLW